MTFPFSKSAPAERTRSGAAAEDLALRYLRQQGLRLLQRNYRTPGRGGGEIDLIMAAPDGTTVFVEVRARSGNACGGAAASVDAAKRRRIIFAARHFLLRQRQPTPCRFDVLLLEPAGLQWLPAAFDAAG